MINFYSILLLNKKKEEEYTKICFIITITLIKLSINSKNQILENYYSTLKLIFEFVAKVNFRFFFIKK